MPRLRVLAGPSIEKLEPITDLVNTTNPFSISTPNFEGQLVVNIKGFTDPEGHVLTSSYFEREDRSGITWSIQFQGRFLRSHHQGERLSADDVLFGNIFDHALKLPWGSSAAFKFMSYIDPTLTHDLGSQTKPWALAPLISTMPHFKHTRLSPAQSGNLNSADKDVLAYDPIEAPPFPSGHSLVDDISQLYKTVEEPVAPGPAPAAAADEADSSQEADASIAADSAAQDAIPEFATSSQRRSYFSNAHNRQKVIFTPQDVITSDFCYGFLEFTPTISLMLPGGLSFDLMRYWDGQPVRFVCCERKRESDDSPSTEPWGPLFWIVSIELVDEEQTPEGEEEAGAPAGAEADVGEID